MFERVREIHRETESGTFLFCESLITRFNSLQGAQITAGIVLLLLLLLLLLLSLCLSLSHSLSLSLSRAVLSLSHACASAPLPTSASVASSWRTTSEHVSDTLGTAAALCVSLYMCFFTWKRVSYSVCLCPLILCLSMLSVMTLTRTIELQPPHTLTHLLMLVAVVLCVQPCRS